MDASLETFPDIAPYLEHPLVLIGFVLLLFFGVHRTLLKANIIPPVGPRVGGRLVQTLLRYGFILALLVIVLGFALQFYQTHRDTGTAQEIQALVAPAIEGLREELRAKERELAAYREREKSYAEREESFRGEFQALTAAVEALPKQAAIPNGDARIREALEEAKRGRTEAAEAIFREVAERKEAEIRVAAEAYRHLGALAFLRDTEQAVAAYRRAVQLDPDDPDGWLQLGALLRRTGPLFEAEDVHQRVVELGKRLSDPRLEAIGYLGLGDVERLTGNTAGALAAYRAGLAIAERLAEADPGNAGWQRDLSVSHDRIGDMLAAQGDTAGALAAYRAGLAIRERLAEADPGNAGWQTDVVVSLFKLSQLLKGNAEPEAQHEAGEALETALAILRDLHAQSRLTHRQRGWIGIVEQQLDEVRSPKKIVDSASGGDRQ